MNQAEHQKWPDGTQVRFTDEAKRLMKHDLNKPNRLPMPVPAGGAEAIYTIDNSDDILHDVILRENSERWGDHWLEECPVGGSLFNGVHVFGDHPTDLVFVQRPSQLSNTGLDLDAEQPSWERGNWMQTFTGKQFYPLDPQAQDVNIDDIAHALSMQCRYNGHVKKFYSVAEHCVLISRLVAPEHALWALLHDATEAYVGDMVRPLKLHLPQYIAVEEQVMAAIAEKFGIGPGMPAEVKEADSRILLDERAALLGTPAGDWGIPGAPHGIDIPAWSPAEAEAQYLARFAELTGQSGDNP